MAFNFEKLDVYEESIDFVNEVYLLTKNFPKEELLGLTGQFRRAAVSIAANIAEGSARSKRSFNRFVDIARGSVFECVAILQISLTQNYIDKSKFNGLEDRLIKISKMLSGLKSSLTKNLKP